MGEQNEAIALYLEALNKYNEGNCEETLNFLHEATEAARGTNDFDLLQKIYNLTAATYESKTRCFAGRAEEIQMLEKAIEALQREKHLHRAKKDEEAEIVTIFDLCRLIERIKPNSEELEELYQEATKLAQKSNNQSLLCKSWRRLGEYYMLRGRHLRLQLATLKDTVEKMLLINSSFSEAVTSYQNASDIARANLFNDEIGFLTGDLANAYYEQGIYNKANELYMKRFRIAEGEKDRCAMRRTYSALGNLNRKIGRNDEATKYYRLALAIACELDDRRSMAMQYISLGELKVEEVDWEDATMYALKAIDVSRQANDLGAEAQAYRLMAEMYSTQLSYSKAAYCLAVLRHLSKKLDRQEQVNYAHEQLCRLKKNQLEEVDGRLVLDSSDDSRPYRIGLTTSLTSLNDSFSLSPEAVQSLGMLTPSSSQSFQRDAQHDDYLDNKLDQVASWKIEEQREQVQIQSVKRVETSKKRRSSLLSWLRF